MWDIITGFYIHTTQLHQSCKVSSDCFISRLLLKQCTYVLATYVITALTLFVIAVSTTNNVCTYDTHGWNRNHFKLWSYVHTQQRTMLLAIGITTRMVSPAVSG